MAETQTYVTTERAGFRVAARCIPGEHRTALDAEGKPMLDEHGKPKEEVRPQIGFELQLTEAEAEYELQQGTIILKPADAKKPNEKPKGKADVETPSNGA